MNASWGLQYVRTRSKGRSDIGNDLTPHRVPEATEPTLSFFSRQMKDPRPKQALVRYVGHPKLRAFICPTSGRGMDARASCGFRDVFFCVDWQRSRIPRERTISQC